MWNLPSQLRLSIQFSGIKFIHIVAQPTPPSIFRILFILQKWNSLTIQQGLPNLISLRHTLFSALPKLQCQNQAGGSEMDMWELFCWGEMLCAPETTWAVHLHNPHHLSLQSIIHSKTWDFWELKHTGYSGYGGKKGKPSFYFLGA